MTKPVVAPTVRPASQSLRGERRVPCIRRPTTWNPDDNHCTVGFQAVQGVPVPVVVTDFPNRKPMPIPMLEAPTVPPLDSTS